MMEVFIAGLILIGVLAAGGVVPDTASTAAPESLPVASAPESACAEANLVCGNGGPHQRDLTAPYVSRPPVASTGSEGRVDCRDG